MDEQAEPGLAEPVHPRVALGRRFLAAAPLPPRGQRRGSVAAKAMESTPMIASVFRFISKLLTFCFYSRTAAILLPRPGRVKLSARLTS